MIEVCENCGNYECCKEEGQENCDYKRFLEEGYTHGVYAAAAIVEGWVGKGNLIGGHDIHELLKEGDYDEND